GTGLVERNTDHVHQEGKHHQDFDAILAARRHAGDAWLLTAGGGKDAVADAHGPAIFQTPHRPLADQLAIAVADTVGIDVFGAIGLGKLQRRRRAPWRFLAATSAPAAALFFGSEA